MYEENTFELNKTAISNLEGILRDMGKLHEQAVCEISFAAEALAADAISLIDSGMTVNELVSFLSEEIRFPSVLPQDGKPSLTDDNVKGFLSQSSNLNRVIFASLFNKRLAELGVNISESDYLPSAESEETFTFVKNLLSDEAFDVFSQEFSDPRIVYADSFKDACQRVSDGRVGYCILPFEEKGGARINSICELIASNDLKIVAITPVFGLEGNADMKYALVGRGFVIPECDEVTDRYLEIDIVRNSSVTMGEVISAAEYLGISVYSIDTSVRDAAESDFTYTVIFKDSNRTFTDFLTYLNLFAGNYSPVGIYKNIE